MALGPTQPTAAGEVLQGLKADQAVVFLLGARDAISPEMVKGERSFRQASEKLVSQFSKLKGATVADTKAMKEAVEALSKSMGRAHTSATALGGMARGAFGLVGGIAGGAAAILLGGVFGLFRVVVGALVGALKLLVELINILLTPLKMVVGLLVRVVTLPFKIFFGELTKAFRTIWSYIMSLSPLAIFTESLGDTFSGLAALVRVGLSPLLRTVNELLYRLALRNLPLLYEFSRKMSILLVTKLWPYIERMSRWMGEFINKLIEFDWTWANVKAKVIEAATYVWTKAIEVWDAVVAWFKNDFPTWWETNVTPYITAIWDGMGKAWEKYIEPATQRLIAFVEPILKGLIDYVVKNIGGWIKEAIKGRGTPSTPGFGQRTLERAVKGGKGNPLVSIPLGIPTELGAAYYVGVAKGAARTAAEEERAAKAEMQRALTELPWERATRERGERGTVRTPLTFGTPFGVGGISPDLLSGKRAQEEATSTLKQIADHTGKTAEAAEVGAHPSSGVVRDLGI